MSKTTASQILEAIGPSCRDTARRVPLITIGSPNGIDFIEYEEIAGPPARHVLHVHFLTVLPTVPAGDPYLFHSDPSSLRVHGGTRIPNISVLGAAPSATDPTVLDVDVDVQGDFSPYLLAIGWSRDDAGTWMYDFPAIDRLYSVGPINFRPGCPVDFDCAPVDDCPPDVLPEPALDYLARDYASFRQLLLDLVAQRNETWTERSPADVGIALLELFAYEGDQISYFQDAVSNEAFLDTARQRVSAKRHAKLVDYTMHDGRNAWTYVHYQTQNAGSIPPGTQLVTHIASPMRFDRDPAALPTILQPTAAPDTVLHTVTDLDYRTDPALAQVRVFETANTVAVDPLNNRLRLHTWGNEQCCLPRGTTRTHVYAVDAALTNAVRPPLRIGDLLLLEEVLGPTTGVEADADPTHRQIVRIVDLNPDPAKVPPAADTMRDPLFLATLGVATHEPTPAAGVVPFAQTLPLVEVIWGPADALTFPLCLSAKLDTQVHGISVARGNIGLADHGRTVQVEDDHGKPEPEHYEYVPPLTGDPTFRLRLAEGPLTMQCQPDDDPHHPPAGFPPLRERIDLSGGALDAHPAVALRAWRGANSDIWLPVPDLLSSEPSYRQFVVDVDDEGRGVLRFGDGQYGAMLEGVDRVEILYRVGNGSTGNIGADSLGHIVQPDVPPLTWPTITALRNPLPAATGVDAELIEQVRLYAPAAFRAVQFRAVTVDDYKKAALTIPGVADAVASFRWTGSWYTVFVGIDPTDPENVLTDLRGFTRLADAFKQTVIATLTRYRLAGYDLEIRAARYVPLDIAIQICAKPGYFREDVAHAVSIALSSGLKPDGTPGLFNPANFTFGQPVYLSRVYATVADVVGCESATVMKFCRHGRDPGDELANGLLPVGAWEIARLDNDPSNMENGTLTLTAGGGS